MNDIRARLATAVDDPQLPDGAVEADLLRGRRALRRHRVRRTALPVALATAGVSAIGLVQSGGGMPNERGVAVGPARAGSPANTPNSTAIRLVAYDGAQPSGYRVASVPSGWEVQGANPFAMTIAPVGAADAEPSSFGGKLVVMLQSRDATGTPAGRPLPVDGRPGYLNEAELTRVLTYRDSLGHWLQVQVPQSLRWADNELAAFAAGVDVTADAEASRG